MGEAADLIEWLRLIGSSATDTVVSVTLPVAALLWFSAWMEASGRFDPSRLLARAGRRQPVYAAAIAAIPGCAGGILVSRLYVEGVAGSAALWAAHIATAGDASFVLLVGRPLVAVGIFAFLFVLGSVAGVAFAGRQRPVPAVTAVAGGEAAAEAVGVSGLPGLPLLWFGAILFAGALALVARVAPGGAAVDLAAAASAAAVLLAVAVQRNPEPGVKACVVSGVVKGGRGPVLAAVRQAAKDASEITLWVAAADVAFAVVQHLWGTQVGAWLQAAVLPVTLLAAAVGMIPGCGPQIFLARLYTAGSLPFVALLANAVSQHGDAIFPLLGRRGRQALRATVANVALAVLICLPLLALHLGG